MGVYDGIKLLQHRKTLEMIESGRGTDCIPLHVHIEPTEACNFRCVFCHWHDDNRRATIPHFDFTGKRHLDLNRLLTLIDELAELGTRAISFTGAGDPLVYQGMEQVLRAIRERGMYSAVTSNMAMRMSDTLIKELAKAKWVRWSMNAGTPEIYVKTHNPREANGSKAFERVQENARRLNNARKNEEHPTDFNASYVVSTVNQHDILPAAHLASALELDNISFRPDTPFERQMSPNKYSREVERDFYKAQKELETEQFKVYMSVERLEDVQKSGNPELVCFYSNHTTYIAANGDVYPCCYTRYHSGYVMGNILEQDLKEFWFSERRRQNYKKVFYDTCPPCPYGLTNQVLGELYKGRKSAKELHVSVKEKDFFI